MQLRSAIAFETAEHVAGQAFAVQTHHGRIAVALADNQRDMVRRFLGAAKSDDLGGFARRDRQVRARRDFEPRRIEQGGDVGGGTDGFGFALRRAHEKGGEQARVARHRHRGRRRSLAAARDRAERSFERIGEVERRVGDRQRRCDARGAIREPHRTRRCGGALVGKLQRYRALARDQQVGAAEFGQRRIARAFDSEQIESPVGAFDPKGPAAAQRVDRTRGAAGAAVAGRRVAQNANSVTSGIWSDGRSQLRAGWTTRWLCAAFCMSGVTHIWSSRRPRFDASQSFAR